MFDLLGKKIKVGDYIAYALTAGRSANLAIFEVTDVLEDRIKAKR